ncbi:MAG: CoA pyrophosphatase [Myxococcota bacterium]
MSDPLDRSAHPFGDAAEAFDADRFEMGLRALAAHEPLVFPEDAVPSDFAQSAVLLPFWREGDEIVVLLTKRAATLRGHPGMMAFPGGRLEPGERFVEGALRETEEEVGIPADAIEVLGRLDDAWSGSRHRLVPIVGWLEARPEIVPNPDEVASVHTPRMTRLLRSDAWSRKAIRLGDTVHYDPTIRWEDDEVYGLTADLFVEAALRALGRPASSGADRLRSLHAWLAVREAEAR